MRLRQRTPENCEILCEKENLTAVDQAVTRHDAIAWKPLLVHSKVFRAVDDKFIEFLKTAFVEEKIDPLAGSHFPRRALLLHSGGPTAFLCQARTLLQQCELIL